MKEKIIKYCDWIIEICLCLIVFCLPFTKAGTETFIWLAVFFWIFKRMLGYRSSSLWGLFPETKLNKSLGMLVAVNAISVIFSLNHRLSLRGFFGKELKFLAIYFMVFEVINSGRRLKNVLITIVISVLLILIDAAVQYFSGVDFLRGYSLARLTASFGSANALGGWLLIVIFIFLGLLLFKQNGGLLKKIKKNMLFGMLTILSLICLILTYSRGAWLGFFIGVVVFIYHYVLSSLSFKNKVLWYLVIGLLSVAVFLASPQIIQERVSSIGDMNINLNRTSLWKESISIIEDFPVFGSGLNTYSAVARNYKMREGGGIYPHNSFLQKAAETGVLGLVAFLWILFSFFNMGIRHFKQKNNYLILGFLSGILAFLVQSFFDTNIYSLQLVVLFWFMLGLTTAAIRIDIEEVKNR